MKLKLYREPSGADATFGVLTVDGKIECYTLENSHKIIPLGTYRVQKYYSNHNQTEVPLLQDVPGRTAIEIHVANYFHQLEGCIAVGFDISTRPMLSTSRIAFKDLMSILDFTDLTIEITQL